ncbi:SMI1/KNR4 family protein [Rhodopirellula europaea]|jgi:hypothetical protein|nr:SMI1/KNR4 family protein [Rhodopirellula europaea]
MHKYAKRLTELGMEPPDEAPLCDIYQIENATGVKLPKAYRTFLQKCGDWWGDILCPAMEPTPFGEHIICAIHSADGVYRLLDSMITPRNMITIGSGHFGSFTCLSIAGIDRGAVYALDSEFRSRWPDSRFHERFNAMADSIKEYLKMRADGKLPDKHDSYDSVFLLAEDFDSFLTRCHPPDDDDGEP